MLADIDLAGVQEAAAVLRSEGIAAASCGGDVGTRADADGMVAAAVAAFGGLDVLVANAGIVRAAPFLEMSEARRADKRTCAGVLRLGKHLRLQAWDSASSARSR